MPANDHMPRAWSRRSLLVALMAGSVTVLPGCRVRLEGDAPRILDRPARQPMPDEQALLVARRDALRLQELAAGLGGSSTSLTELLATLHERQADVLDSVLRVGGVPPSEIIATPTTTAGVTTSTTSPAPAGVTELVAAEAEVLGAQALSDLADISKDQVALFGSMTAQRAAAVRLMRGQLPSAGTLAAPNGEEAAAQLEAIRSAVYGFEVVTAQTDPSHRKAASKTLSALRAKASELQLLAGSAAKPIPLGYALPFPVSTPASALKLASHLMTGLRQAIASQLPAVAGDVAGLTWTIHLLADVSVQAVIWQVPLTAFPGLNDT